MKLLTNQTHLCGTVEVPGDKSISHRSIMFGAISQGTTTVKHFLRADDCISTMNVFKQLGVTIHDNGDTIVIEGCGFEGLKDPHRILDVGNSGTAIRLLMGILAGTSFTSVLEGDDSIAKRPMNRVMQPLREMGIECSGNSGTEFPPITVVGSSNITPIHYEMPVASAQVKSAILFAALQANGESVIIEKEKSRNHTEEMILQFGGKIDVDDKEIRLNGGQTLSGTNVLVPGDISSAAFFLAIGLLIQDSTITLKNVGLNETRTGIIDVIKAMNGKLSITPYNDGSVAGDIEVETSSLVATEVAGDLIPRLIDEIPIIALLATQAKGTTVIKDAAELKVKETNRIDAVATELNKLGAHIVPTEDGMIIEGGTKLHSGKVTSYGDHRIGMMLQVAALLVDDGEIELEKAEAVSISYPDFFKDVNSLINKKDRK